MDSFRTGTGRQKDQDDERVGTLSPHPFHSLLGGERGWRLNQSSKANDLISRAHRKRTEKPLNNRMLRASRLVNTSTCQEGGTSQLHRTFWTSAPVPLHPAVHLFLYNKLVIVSYLFLLSSVSWSTKLPNLGRRWLAPDL